MIFGGNIPIGGGLSSSSAIECGFLKLLNEWLDLKLDHESMIGLSRKSNHNLLGLQGGIMDQYAILNGQSNHAMLLNCEDNTSTQVPINTIGHSFVLIDSNVSHELVNSAYNDRVTECQEALSIIQTKYSDIKTISQTSTSALQAMKKSLTAEQHNRVKFVLEENDRVHHFCKALRLKQFSVLGDILYASHNGLRDEYEVSCKETDLLVSLAHKSDHVLGARMIGGGFGGCTLNLIKTSQRRSTAEKIARSYNALTGITPKVYEVEIVDGVSVERV